MVFVLLTEQASKRVAWAGGIFAACGMLGLAAAHGFEGAAYGLLRSGNAGAATAALAGDDLGLPGITLLVLFLGGASLGLISLAVAVWRSPLLPRIVAPLMLAFAVLDFALGYAVVSHVVNLIGFGIAAAAVVSGYSRAERAVVLPRANAASAV